MNIDEEKLQQELTRGRALASPTTRIAVLSTVNRILNEWGGRQPMHKEYPRQYENYTKLTFNSHWNKKDLTVSVHVKSEDLYDAITTHKLGICTLKEIYVRLDREMVLVSHGISCFITMFFETPMPETDLYTLRMLGKVKTSRGYYSPSTESIYCEMPNVSPF